MILFLTGKSKMGSKTLGVTSTNKPAIVELVTVSIFTLIVQRFLFQSLRKFSSSLTGQGFHFGVMEMFWNQVGWWLLNIVNALMSLNCSV